MIPLLQILCEWDRLERHCAGGRRTGRQRIRDHLSEYGVLYICLASIPLYVGASVVGRLLHGGG